MRSNILIIFIVFLFFACHPALREETKRPVEALVPVRYFFPSFEDDSAFSSLEEALKRNLEYFEKIPPDRHFKYGRDTYTLRDVIETQEAFLSLIREGLKTEEFKRRLKKDFNLYRATGRAGNKRVLFTGYFEPLFEARLAPDETFRHPIYKKPQDLVEIDLSLFSEEFKGKSVVARIEGSKIIPYYSRRQIALEKALEGRNLEMAWLKDPVDVAFLQIQGSGRLVLGEGKTMSVGYAGKNGHPYRAVGKYLVEKGFLELEDVSMQSIRRLLSRYPEVVDEALNYNPSYVFFKNLGGGPIIGSMNVPITPGRTVALDYRLFPPGALVFMKSKKPEVNERGEITRWEDFSRFVVNQDTGGAIRGAGRADLFWGSGPYAELAAGHLKHEGDLYVLVKKREKR
ncbi:MAG: MltA domain-containing protein [Deltaproteobacteria bacterium]|nr:MltA domain-containing protein [Deltaproteobacteria bacterium]